MRLYELKEDHLQWPAGSTFYLDGSGLWASDGGKRIASYEKVMEHPEIMEKMFIELDSKERSLERLRAKGLKFTSFYAIKRADDLKFGVQIEATIDTYDSEAAADFAILFKEKEEE